MKAYLLIFACCAMMIAGCAPSAPESVEKSEDSSSSAVAAPSTPQAQFESAKKEYDDKYAAFIKTYQSAETNSDRQAAIKTMPKPVEYADGMMEIATSNPDTETAVDALVWVASNARGAKGDEAKKLIVDKYIDNPKAMPIIFMSAYDDSDETRGMLRGLIQHKDKSLAGVACYSLGSILLRDDEKVEEGVALMQTVVDEYDELVIKMGKRELDLRPKAEGALFEKNNLEIGMIAPDIEAADLDGVTFKLSDYRGKVIVLDFWGDW